MKNKKILITICVILVLSICGFGYLQISNNKQSEIEGVNKKQMRAICELASIETFYHNTAKYYHEKTVAFFIKSSQTLWIEYDSSVKIGTDISKLDLDVKGNKVTITIPHSKILSHSIVASTLKPDSYHTDYSGWFADGVDFSDEQQTFKDAEKKVLNQAKKNDMLFVQADERAEELLSNYVENIGEITGKDYKVGFNYLDEK